MQRKAKQFEPADQFAELMTEIGDTLADLPAKIERLAWLRKKIAEQHAAAIAAADRFETFSESEAAAKFGTDKDEFRRLRAKHEFPFLRVGKHVRYTPEQLREIAALLEMNGKRRIQPAAMPRLKAA